MSVRIIAFFIAAAFFGNAAPALAADPVYVMRHLQKGEGADPSLSLEGAANARSVADLLESRGVSAVFATPTRRAEETGAPLAERLGIAVTHYDPRDPAALVAAVRAAGGAVLVVGHSNTVPDLVARFGGAAPPPIGEQDYGTIYVVDDDSGRVAELHVGRAAQ